MKLLPYRGSTVAWPLYALTPETQGKLRRALTYRLPTPYLSRGLVTESPVVTAYGEKPGYLLLPRHLRWAEFGLCAPVRRFQLPPESVSTRFTQSLRENQQEAATALESRLRRQDDGILSLSCGKGKTVLAVYGWTTLNRPGLAVVPTLQIADQWKTRLREFTDIRAERIGQIGGGRNEWEDCDFVVGTIQTLAQKRFPREFYRHFGVVYFDECHRLGAPWFSTVGGLFDGVRIGLSATWRRADGLEKLFALHLGPVFYEDHGQDLIPEVYFVRTEANLNLARFRMWGGRGDINFAKVITTLARDEVRQRQVLGLILDAYREGRKILVLGDRKEELVTYKEALTTQDVSCGVCVGSLEGRVVSQHERDVALNRRVVLATSQLVKEGLDKKDIDTLIILYPKSNQAFAEQAAGRILRTHDGKDRPIIVVINDYNCTMTERGKLRRPFGAQCRTMEKHFRRLGYTIGAAA